MKVITRIFIAVLSLAVVGFLAVAMFAPEKGRELETRLENFVNQKSEEIEVSPVRELSIEYELPLEDENLLYTEYGFEYGVENTWPDKVYTWFRDLGRDLWLPFDTNDAGLRFTVGDVVLIGREGIVKRLSPGEYAGSSDSGEAVIYAPALEDVPQGDYWAALLFSPEHPKEPYHMPYYLLRYVGIYDECAFHTEDYDLSVSKASNLLVDRSTGEGFTYHLLNLGDNVVTDVWKLENMMGQYTRKHLTKGEDYTVSEDGASVTLTAAYLDSLQNLYGYHFMFGLGDHSEFSTADTNEWGGTCIYLTDGPVPDLPYVSGPETYSVSSGEDYVLTVHTGRAIQIWENGGGMFFFNAQGPALVNENGDEISVFTVKNDDIREDETCVIPAAVFQEAAERGDEGCWLGVSFQITDFGASGLYYYRGLNIYLTP